MRAKHRFELEVEQRFKALWAAQRGSPAPKGQQELRAQAVREVAADMPEVHAGYVRDEGERIAAARQKVRGGGATT